MKHEKNIQLSDAIYEKLQMFSREDGCSISEIVINALKLYETKRETERFKVAQSPEIAFQLKRKHLTWTTLAAKYCTKKHKK
jgi:predicted CopG family antitoxin